MYLDITPIHPKADMHYICCFPLLLLWFHNKLTAYDHLLGNLLAEWKTTRTEMKNLLKGLNNRSELAEERSSKLREIMQSDEQREKRMTNIKKAWKIGDALLGTPIHCNGITRGGKKGGEKYKK